MAKKENNFYFDSFAKGVVYANDAIALLQECFDKYDPAHMEEQIKKMHEIEHEGDGVKHEMMERLAKEFLPPIEREDIVELSHIIDDVTDSIEDVLQGMYMFNVKVLRPEVKEFTNLIARCCEALKDVTQEMHNFRKSAVLQEKIIEINALEEEGDRLYSEAMRRLYTEEKDPVAILVWTTMYDRLEKCCDGCEDVADMVEQVVMKNS
ncbi:MAG: DUF47 domain-containing protein [Lachnospiraceae bacterium]|nr:DUF47 domain-containing protein [Lachnospiraceae bacterium]